MNTVTATRAPSALTGGLLLRRRRARYMAIALRLVILAPAVVVTVLAVALTLLIESLLSGEPA